MDIFYALAEPTRRNIIEILAQGGQLTATDIYNHFKVSKAAISQHLKVLKEAKLVKVEKRAQQRIYQINKDSIVELEEWARKTKEVYEARFDRLEKLLESEKQVSSK